MSTVVLVIHGKAEEFQGDFEETAKHIDQWRIHRRLIKLTDKRGYKAYVDPWAVTIIRPGEVLEEPARARGRTLEVVDLKAKDFEETDAENGVAKYAGSDPD